MESKITGIRRSLIIVDKKPREHAIEIHIFGALPRVFSACTRAKRTFFVPNSILIGNFWVKLCNFLGEGKIARSGSLITVVKGWPVIAID